MQNLQEPLRLHIVHMGSTCSHFYAYMHCSQEAFREQARTALAELQQRLQMDDVLPDPYSTYQAALCMAPKELPREISLTVDHEAWSLAQAEPMLLGCACRMMAQISTRQPSCCQSLEWQMTQHYQLLRALMMLMRLLQTSWQRLGRYLLAS